MRLLRLAAGVLALLVAAAPVRAVEDPDTEISKRHFTAGAALYDRGKYAEAIIEFTAARDVRPAPAFDFNIARCHDRLEHVHEAIVWYERYLATNPTAEADGGARARLAQLEERERRRARYPVAVPAVIGGVTLAAWIAGGVLYGVSGSQFDHDKAALGCGKTRACGSDVWGGTQTMERAGIGLMVTGGVLTVLDVALWAAWRRR